ncbi:MAG TPA: phosphoribosylanthranilate isomerase [Bacillales bacterium]|nr:phosphoribosylanthranilate isomerase [Bacillales bacterium]
MTRLLVKYCGNRSLADVKLTAGSRADYLGFLLTPHGKRFVEPEAVAQWLEAVPLQAHQRVVGLFVNATKQSVISAADVVRMDIIQCHGSERPERVADIAEATGLPVWKAIHHERSALDKMKAYAGIAAGYVVDCKVAGQWGGTGFSFDWRAIPGYMEEARRQGVPCFIAGGIRPENIDDVLAYDIDGIDLASGIEEQNEKSGRKMRELEERMRYHGN